MSWLIGTFYSPLGEPKPAARPRPTVSPRRSHFQADRSVATSQQSSGEEDVTSVTWPSKTKETHPVAPPRTSPRQHQEKRTSPDMNSSRPVPRARPALSSRKGELKLFEKDPDVDEYERTKISEEYGGIYENERRTNATEKPLVPDRRKKTLEESPEKDTERDHSRFFESEETRNVPGEKPMVPSRRKKALEETHEKHIKKDDEIFKYERTKNSPEKPLAPSRRKKSLEKTHEINSRPQAPIIRTSTFEGDGPFEDNDRMAYEEDGNLRKPKKMKGPPVISVTRPDSSEESENEVDSVKVLCSKGLYDRQKYSDDDGDDDDKVDSGKGSYGIQKYDKEDEVDSGKGLYKKGSYGRQKYSDDDDDELSHGRKVTDAKEKSVSTTPTPSPRSRAAVDHSTNIHSQLEEEVKHAKCPGSAPVMKKASSLETLSSRQGSLAKKGHSRANEHGAQKVQLKKSLTPQRPTSGKKGSLLAQLRQKATSDIVDTFEEHVPPTENVIEIASDDRSFRRKSDRGNTRETRQLSHV